MLFHVTFTLIYLIFTVNSTVLSHAEASSITTTSIDPINPMCHLEVSHRIVKRKWHKGDDDDDDDDEDDDDDKDEDEDEDCDDDEEDNEDDDDKDHEDGNDKDDKDDDGDEKEEEDGKLLYKGSVV